MSTETKPQSDAERAEAIARGGYKDDHDKPKMGLVPPDFIVAVAEVMTFGAQKYRAYNWAQGMDWSRPYDACQRHLNAWWDGEDRDPQSGLSHIAHAACCLAFLIVFQKRRLGTDDRPPWAVAPKEGP